MYCENCNSDDATKVTIKYHTIEYNIFLKKVSCNKCAGSSIAPSYPRDAMGNRVIGPKDNGSFYSYATDKVHTSTRHFADHLKKEGLIQKDGPNGRKKYF